MARNVFLSFAMEDKNLVDLFRGQAKNKNSDLEFRDYSIKTPFESSWKTRAAEIISRCSVTLCLVGAETYKSEAVEWEIRKSAELGNRVLAMRLSPGASRPMALVHLGVPLMPWDIDTVMRALK